MEQEFTRLLYICIGFCSIYTSLFRKDNCRLAFIRTRGDVYPRCLHKFFERANIRLRTCNTFTYIHTLHILFSILHRIKNKAARGRWWFKPLWGVVASPNTCQYRTPCTIYEKGHVSMLSRCCPFRFLKALIRFTNKRSDRAQKVVTNGTARLGKLVAYVQSGG